MYVPAASVNVCAVPLIVAENVSFEPVVIVVVAATGLPVIVAPESAELTVTE